MFYYYLAFLSCYIWNYNFFIILTFKATKWYVFHGRIVVKEPVFLEKNCILSLQYSRHPVQISFRACLIKLQIDMLYVSHKQSNVCPWVFKENINKTFFNKTFLSVKTVDGNYSDIDNLINLLKTHILLKNHLLF